AATSAPGSTTSARNTTAPMRSTGRPRPPTEPPPRRGRVGIRCAARARPAGAQPTFRRGAEMSGRNLAIIVVALRPRSGVTLLARAFADYFILSHENPLIFDTDDVERRLSRHFPQRANVVDLDRIRGQMTLFDTLAAPVAEKRVVDVTHRALN